MTSVPPPQGMDETDYEAIEAAVTETVRGRWFLNEFARRNRAGELRQLLDAMTRLESTVAAGQTVAPPTDPSVRLLMQRIKEIAGQLDMLSLDMREAGIDERFASAVEKEARAVSGMMRGTALPKPPAKLLPVQPVKEAAEEATKAAPAAEPPVAPLLIAPLPAAPSPIVPLPVVPAAPAQASAPSPAAGEPGDARPATLAELDALPLRDKLLLFA